MQKDKIFFGEQGLTSTSANHLANMAKELYQHLTEELGSVKFYSESISLLGDSSRVQFSTGDGSEFLASIRQKLDEIASLKSLIAWLREAIKARKRLSEELEDTDFSAWCTANGIEVPSSPVRDHVLTEDEYYASLSIKERNAYYELETRCAVIGQYIHEGGKLSTERAKLSEVLGNEHILREAGRDTTIISRKPTVSIDEVDNVFFMLQTLHRGCQAQLNAIKHKCDLAIEASQLAADAKYREELSAYNAARNELVAQFTEWKHQQAIALQSLKIIIPDSLSRIYAVVNGMGSVKND